MLLLLYVELEKMSVLSVPNDQPEYELSIEGKTFQVRVERHPLIELNGDGSGNAIFFYSKK